MEIVSLQDPSGAICILRPGRSSAGKYVNVIILKDKGMERAGGFLHVKEIR